MLLLPKNLEALARLTCKSSGDDHRYALECVRVEHQADRYTACATNGRVLGLVRGTADSADDYPAVPALTAAPNGQTAALVSRDDWTRAFRTVPMSRRTSAKPILRNVACVMGRGVATLGTTDLETQSVVASHVDANRRYPNPADVLPTGEPTLTVTVDPTYLAELLTVAAQYTTDAEAAVTLEFRTKRDRNGQTRHAPVVVRAANGTQEFTGLLVPLDRQPVAAPPVRQPAPEPVAAPTVAAPTVAEPEPEPEPVAVSDEPPPVAAPTCAHLRQTLTADGWTCRACAAVVS